MLQKIKKSKYPAITAEEEAVSIPLQTLCQAIFDAILVHIVNTVSAGGKWQQLQQQMCDALNRRKDEHTIGILSRTYYDADVLFIQEAASMFMATAGKTALGAQYHIAASSSLDGKRDQNSIILLRRDYFDLNTLQEHTSEVMAALQSVEGGKPVPVANGDVFVISVHDIFGRPYLLASFHGDTNGLATKPVLAAVDAAARARPGHTLLFGLDANTYEVGDNIKYQQVLDFAAAYGAAGYTSCWGDVPDPKNHTTYNARTFLQAQLQKAARVDELAKKGDKNPKDFVLFPKGVFAVAATTKDNTGERRYVEGMVFPTLAFPSDHGVLATTLKDSRPPVKMLR